MIVHTGRDGGGTDEGGGAGALSGAELARVVGAGHVLVGERVEHLQRGRALRLAQRRHRTPDAPRRAHRSHDLKFIDSS